MRVVLAGMGYTNLLLLHALARNPLLGADLVCVSDSRQVLYSGMLPGVLAGEYRVDDASIDVGRLARFANAEFHKAVVTGLDRPARTLVLASGLQLPYDVLSVALGSRPSFEGVQVVDASRLVPHKPLGSLLARLDAAADAAVMRSDESTLSLVVVGGGAAGVELAFCAPIYVGRAGRRIRIVLVSGSRGPLPDSHSRMPTRAQRALTSRGIEVVAGEVTRVDTSTVVLASGRVLAADIVLWATGAAPVDPMAAFRLCRSDDGFPLVDASLRATDDPSIFVTGDAASVRTDRYPKSGVIAVRQARTLEINVRRTLAGLGPFPFRAPRRTLRLINTGDGRAIGEWGSWSAGGRWVRRWKDLLDRRFVRQFLIASESTQPPKGA